LFCILWLSADYVYVIKIKKGLSKPVQWLLYPYNFTPLVF
jgi:hypothetical protein